jgi:tetratricopeptide (TPR) repeat protein
LGQSYQRSGEFEAAGAAYDQLLARPDAAYWRPLARHALEDTLSALMEKGNALEVATLFLRHETMLMAPAMKSATALAVGEALVRLGFADPAIRVYGAVLTEGQHGTPQQRALVGLAEAYRKKRDFPQEEEAWKSYVRGFQNGRWSSEAQQGLIAVLVRQEKREEAEKFCRQWMAAGAFSFKAAGAAAGTGGVAGALACADLFFQKGQAQLAQGLYEGVLKAGADVPDLLWATYQIGRGYVSAGRPAQAAEFFRKVAKSDANPLLSAAAEAQLTALHISGKR